MECEHHRLTKKIVGARLSIWRKRRGFTQERAGRVLKLSGKTVATHEAGGITIHWLPKYAELYKCKIDSFF